MEQQRHQTGEAVNDCYWFNATFSRCSIGH